MRVGALKKTITFQKRAVTQDSYGAQSETWADFYTMHAALRPLSGRELFTAQAVQPEITHEITIRYLAGITPAMRIKYGETIFNIESIINPDERNRELKIMAKSGANEG